jgi:hypothetical protein
MSGVWSDVYLALLYHAGELAGGKPVTINDMVRKYINAGEPTDIYNYLSHPINHDYVDFSNPELVPSDRRVQITILGAEKVERMFGENVAAVLEQAGIGYNYASSEAGNMPSESVDSADWTGIATRIGPTELGEIRDKVKALRDSIEQSPLDQRAKANALRRVEAVQTLLEAPDPPWKVIVELLNSPLLTAFLNAAAIMTIIFG